MSHANLLHALNVFDKFDTVKSVIWNRYQFVTDMHQNYTDMPAFSLNLQTPNFIKIEICTLLGFYAVYNGNSVPMFRENLWVPTSRMKQSKKNLFFYTVQNPIRVQVLFVSEWKPEIIH
jgi:hypothetical protein